MPLSFRIRPVTLNDLADVKTLFRAYAGALGVDLSYQGFEQEITNLPGAYAPPAGILLLARAAVEETPDAGEALGCVAVRPLPELATCEMKRLYTSPGVRGTGLGRALAEAAVAAASQAGYLAMRLDTLPAMTAAQSLYRRLGFEVTPPYYATPVDGTIFMRKTLTQP